MVCVCACVRAQSKEVLGLWREVQVRFDRDWWCVQTCNVVPWIAFLPSFHGAVLPFECGARTRLALWRVHKAAQAARGIAVSLHLV